MNEEESLTLEDEFAARLAASKQMLQTIQSLAESVTLYAKKLYEKPADSPGTDPTLNLFNYIHDEVTRAIHEIEQFCKSANGSLLPVCSENPCKLILAAIGQLRDPALEYHLRSADNVRDEGRVRMLYDTVIRDFELLQQHIIPRTREQILEAFSQFLTRYIADNKASLDTYRDKISDRSESMKALDDDYKDSRIIEYWKHNDHDIYRTIGAMHKDGYTEIDLFTLVGYIVHYEIINGIAAPIIRKEMAADASEALHVYLMQLQPLTTPSWQASFSQLVSAIIADTHLFRWLTDTARCKDFRIFNKTRVFKLARMLRNKNVLTDFADTVLNQVLEASDEDTSYRKAMSTNTQNDNDIESVLSHLSIKIVQK